MHAIYIYIYKTVIMHGYVLVYMQHGTSLYSHGHACMAPQLRVMQLDLLTGTF